MKIERRKEVERKLPCVMQRNQKQVTVLVKHDRTPASVCY